MTAKNLAALLCGVVSLGVGACGARTAPDPTAPQSQTPRELRSQAQELLRSTENLLAGVVATGEGYATEHLDRNQALERLSAAHNHARALRHQAERLPTASAARGVEMNLTAELAATATTLRHRIQSGQVKAPADIRSELNRLRDGAFQAFHRLRDRLPFILRRQIQRTVDRIFSLTG
jgi:hypothetical protein